MENPIQLFKPKYRVDECLAVLHEVLSSGWTGSGPFCREFEKQWCSFTGSSRAHFVNSATAALHIALRLLDLPKGSKILTTPLTFISTNAVILYEGHEPVFVDVNKDDLSMDAVDFLKKGQEHQAKASIWVHYGGIVSSHFDRVKNAMPSLPIIEDAAHAGGAFYSDGERVGSRGSGITCFSFQSVKNLPTFDGGMLCVPNDAMLERAKKLSWLGIDKDTYTRTSEGAEGVYKWMYTVPELGWKYNGNDISAAIGNTQLKYLDEDNAYRRQIYHWYKENFQGYDHILLLEHPLGSAHHLVVIRVTNQSEVIAALKKSQIAPGVHYLPNYQFPIFHHYYKEGQCPNVERISKEIISLPNHLFLTREEVNRVSEIVINAAARSYAFSS